MLSLNISTIFSFLILFSIVFGLLFILPSILRAEFFNYTKSKTIAGQKSIFIIDDPINYSSISLEEARIFANISTPQEKTHGDNTSISKPSLLGNTKKPVNSA